MYKSFSATSFGLGAAAMTAAVLMTGTANAQTPIKFSLDFKFEGPSAPFLVAIDKGYFKAEGLDVTIDSAAGSVERWTLAYESQRGKLALVWRLPDQTSR